MNNQKFPLSIGLLFILASLGVAPIKANAGSQPVIGVTEPGSPAYIGNTFIPPAFQGTGFIGTPASNVPGVTVNPTGGGFIVTPAVQNAVNNAAANLPQLRGNNPGQGNNDGGGQGNNAGGQPATPVVAAVRGDRDAGGKVAGSLKDDGAPEKATNDLEDGLTGLFESPTSATPGVPMAQLAPGQLVASAKGLAVASNKSDKSLKEADAIIAQNGATPQVNLTKLSKAINAFNAIVNESSPVALEKLSQNQNFLEIREVLSGLRSAL